MRTNLKICLAALLMVACMGIDAQTVRRIDPARLKKIVYPPLTEREGKDLQIPVPPADHPRLYFRKSDLPAIKIKTTHPLLKPAWDRINQNAQVKTDGKLEQGVIHNFNNSIIDAIEARAFLYAYSGDEKMGIEAIDLIFNMNNTLIINHKKGDVCREIGRVIVATAIVYDWCYDLIVPAERKQLVDIMESLAFDMEVQWPRLTQASVTGHGVEAQLSRDILSMGVATWNEKPEIYRRAAGRIFAELIPAQDYNYLSGYHHQGSAYGPGRYGSAISSTLIFDRMGYPNVTSKLQGKMPYYWMYTRRPDGKLFLNGDDWQDRNPFGFYWIIFDLHYVASYYQDPILMGEAIKQGVGRSLFDFLFVDPSVQPDYNLSQLPLTRYFPSSFGGMVARTGWESGTAANTVVAEMKIKERQYNNHQHLDVGSFQLYYKGPLAVETGMYQGTEGSYNGAHFLNYYQRTIAHNCMLVYDPDEKFVRAQWDLVNDGGQRWPRNGNEPATIDVVLSDDHHMGEVVAHHFGPDAHKPAYSYLKGDITKAYTAKVKNHQRSFVFLNLDNEQVPAAFFVYDYIVSSNKDFKKTWLLHCVQEPVFNGNICTVISNEKGYNGKLVNTVLLPSLQNTNLEKIGGEGNEFNVGGTNFAQRQRNENNSNDNAKWRIELSPKTPSETDVFLNVMQVTDAGNTKLLPVVKIETETMTGAQIGDRIVLFAKNGLAENRPVNLTIKGAGTFNVLITDLEKGNWEITGPKTPGLVRNDHQLVYFQATAGEYKITKK